MTGNSNVKEINNLKQTLVINKLIDNILFSKLSYPTLVAQWLERLHGKRKVLGSIPGLGKHFLPKHDCSLHLEQSLKSSWMIGEDLRQNTLAWHTCPGRYINVWLLPEDHQLRLENQFIFDRRFLFFILTQVK